MGMVCSPRPVQLGVDESYCLDLADTLGQVLVCLREVKASHSEKELIARKGHWVVMVDWVAVPGGRMDFQVIDLSDD